MLTFLLVYIIFSLLFIRIFLPWMFFGIVRHLFYRKPKVGDIYQWASMKNNGYVWNVEVVGIKENMVSIVHIYDINGLEIKTHHETMNYRKFNTMYRKVNNET